MASKPAFNQFNDLKTKVAFNAKLRPLAVSRGPQHEAARYLNEVGHSCPFRAPKTKHQRERRGIELSSRLIVKSKPPRE
jgi:hypothetical protein